MNSLRKCSSYLLILAAAYGLAGCATTSSRFSGPGEPSQEDQAWKEMTWGQKTGSVLYGMGQIILYGLGSSGVSFTP